MHMDPAKMSTAQLYRILSGCIIPRPIAWVSTQSRSGINNLAPFSFFNGVASHPPALMISIALDSTRSDGRKDTLRNILETQEFVVNVVSEENVGAMQKTAGDFPPEVDEFQVAGVTPRASVVVRPPRVAESPASFECTLYTTVAIGEGIGSSTLVVGLIRHLFVRDDCINEKGHIVLERLRPIGRLSGPHYCPIREVFQIPTEG